METPFDRPEYKAADQMKCASLGGQPSMQCNLASTLRPSIDHLLKERIESLRAEAFRLEALQRSLPELPHEADRALWDILCRGAR